MCQKPLSEILSDMMGETWDEETQDFKSYITWEGERVVFYLKKLLALAEGAD